MSLFRLNRQKLAEAAKKVSLRVFKGQLNLSNVGRSKVFSVDGHPVDIIGYVIVEAGLRGTLRTMRFKMEGRKAWQPRWVDSEETMRALIGEDLDVALCLWDLEKVNKLSGIKRKIELSEGLKTLAYLLERQ